MTERAKKTIDYLKSVEEAIENGYDECLQGAEELCTQETQHMICGAITAARGLVLMLQAVGVAIVCAMDKEENAEQEKANGHNG